MKPRDIHCNVKYRGADGAVRVPFLIINDGRSVVRYIGSDGDDWCSLQAFASWAKARLPDGTREPG